MRSSSLGRLTTLKERVLACFRGAATSTGATLEITEKGQYLDHVPNRVLGRSYRNAFNQLGGSIPTGDLDELTSATMASSKCSRQKACAIDSVSLSPHPLGC